MGKPLLTDDVLKKVQKEEFVDSSNAFGYYPPDNSLDIKTDEPYWEEDYQGYEEGQTIRIPVEASVVKSRRIETVKREEFRHKVNKILFWVIVLFLLFIFVVLFM